MKIEIMWLIWMMIGVVWVPLVAPADLVIKIPGKFLTRSLSVAKDGNFHIVKALMKPNIEKKKFTFYYHYFNSSSPENEFIQEIMLTLEISTLLGLKL